MASSSSLQTGVSQAYSRAKTPGSDFDLKKSSNLTGSSASLESNNNDDNSPTLSPSDPLLESLDRFLEQLETRLDRFETYFISSKTSKNIKTGNFGSKSISSQQQLVISIEDEVEKFYETLKLVKSSLVESTSNNLENVKKIFTEHYTTLFSSFQSPFQTYNNKKIDESNIPGTPPPESLNMSHQIIDGLEFLEEKLNKVDQLIGNFQPIFNLDYLNYYNLDVAENISNNQNLLHYYQLPFLWRENRYIIHGYRFYNSKLSLLKSIFRFPFHNESFNIWTHLSGAMIVIYLTIFHFPNSLAFQLTNQIDHLAIYLFIAMALNCLVCSTLWHTFTGTSRMSFRNRCVCLDYTGITLLISASIISTQYSTLYYYPKIQFVSIFLVIILAIVGLYLNWSPTFDRPESRPLRVLFFVSLAFTGITCFITLCFYQGFIHSLKFFAPLLPSFSSYGIGVVFYSLLIPERWRTDVYLDEKLPDSKELYHTIHEDLYFNQKNSKEKLDLCSCEQAIAKKILGTHFLKNPKIKNKRTLRSLFWVDYMGSSHSIWHLFVLGGILCHYFGTLEMYSKLTINKP